MVRTSLSPTTLLSIGFLLAVYPPMYCRIFSDGLDVLIADAAMLPAMMTQASCLNCWTGLCRAAAVPLARLVRLLVQAAMVLVPAAMPASVAAATTAQASILGRCGACPSRPLPSAPPLWSRLAFRKRRSRRRG